jgi:hypothetical protein
MDATRRDTVIRIALANLSIYSRDMANAAAQDTKGIHFKPGAVTAYLDFAKDAEELLAEFKRTSAGGG